MHLPHLFDQKIDPKQMNLCLTMMFLNLIFHSINLMNFVVSKNQNCKMRMMNWGDGFKFVVNLQFCLLSLCHNFNSVHHTICRLMFRSSHPLSHRHSFQAADALFSDVCQFSFFLFFFCFFICNKLSIVIKSSSIG